jgi:type IV pilus assembly protein PilX
MERSRGKQHGVALVVSLILLAVATLIGLAGVRGTNLQERMSSNMYDRSLAFQRAESALRAAEDAITAEWQITNLGGVDCSPTAGQVCTVVPADTFSGTSANWIQVDDTHNVNSGKTLGTPEYLIQFMGSGSAENDLGLEANADFASYDNLYPPPNVAFYRITARSSAPADAVDRSIVVLQSTVKRSF